MDLWVVCGRYRIFYLQLYIRDVTAIFESVDFIMKQSLSDIKVARVSTIPFFVISQLKSQLDALVEHGAILTVIASKDEMAEKVMQYNTMNYLPITIRREISLLKDLTTVYKLWKVYRTGKYSVVHSTTPKAGLLSAIAAFLARVPVRLHTFTGQPWVTMSGFKRRLLRFCDWLVVRLNTQCYADSFGQRNFLLQEKIGKEKDIKVLGKGSLAGVDLQRFNPTVVSEEQKQTLRQRLGLSPKRPVFLFVGRITEDKGVFELIEATAQLTANAYVFDVLIVGPFERFIEKTIREKAAAVTNANIHFTGFCDKPEEYFAIADVLCLPSYREGFGTVVIEAAAMGVPAIGTKIYGLSDAIEEGETGLLVAPRSVEELASAMRYLMDEPELRKLMGKAAKERAVAEYDCKLMGHLMVEEYCTLLAENATALPLCHPENMKQNRE